VNRSRMPGLRLSCAIKPYGLCCNMSLFTSESARTMAAKAHEARKRNAESKRNGQLEQEPQRTAIHPAKHGDSYICARLVRVRKQLGALDALIDGEMAKPDADPARLDKLAAALSRLHDIERTLAGRPLPGSLRPTSPNRKVNHLIGDQIPGVG
jgi:hypothetical protein